MSPLRLRMASVVLYNIDSPPTFFFGEIDANGNNSVLQQLSITEVNSSSVPEPSAVVFVASALLLAMKRKVDKPGKVLNASSGEPNIKLRAIPPSPSQS